MRTSICSWRVRALLSTLLLLPLLAGCQWGTRPSRFQPAQSPVGVQVAVRVHGEETDRVGELFAADSGGIVLRVVRLTRIAWSRVAAMDVHQMGDGYDLAESMAPDSAHVTRVAALSRFPQGLSGELLRRVLQHLEQDTLDVAMEGAITVDSLARVAERSSARFRDRRVAMAEGYRRIGSDFPGMGEHWVNPLALLHDVVDPERPSFLTYVTMDDAPRLMGVGFITTTTDSNRGPTVPGGAEHWHEHSGLLAEESGARPIAAGKNAEGRTQSATRVWVLHVWTSLENPEGQFAADNWSLPFVRAGLIPPALADADAARAFGLAGEERGDEFLRALLSDAELRTPATASATDSIISAARARALAIAARLPRERRPDEGSLTELRAVWREMAASLEQLLGGHTAALLAPHRARRHQHVEH
jgi:hypothetical protein